MPVDFEERFARICLHFARIRRRRECVKACLQDENGARRIVTDVGLRERFGVCRLDEAQKKAYTAVNAAIQHGLAIWTRGDPQWLFPETEDFLPPLVLFVKSSIKTVIPHNRRICIVGSRGATRAGMETAHAWARQLAERGFCIVSGGAVGIDAAAHAGALRARGSTWVFLGSGLRVPYPERNADLFDAAAARGGGVFSVGLDHPPARGFFIQRNSLMAACSRAVVVVEAHAGSGALYTARFAASFGHPVWVFPQSPGCARLLAEGARPISGAEELCELAAAAESGNGTRAGANPTPGEGESPEEIARRTGNTLTAVLQQLQIGELNGEAVRLPGGRWLVIHGRE